LKRSARLPVLIAIAVVIGGCTSAAAGWTYAPAPSTTPPPSAAPSDAGASPQPGGSAVQVTAANIAFDQSTLSVPAGAPFQIQFQNDDKGVPHNVEIKDAADNILFNGEVFDGIDQRTYDVTALDAGPYTFLCSVHPTMNGTLTAG
jgi:plastocyanin